MQRHGLAVPDVYVRGDRWSTAVGRDATLELLAADPRPTAIVASSVELALGCMFACRLSGVGIPDDLALATFDDAYFAELLDPSLAAVRYDPMEVGNAAAGLLVDAMRDGAAGERRDLRVPVELVRRSSCGCAT